MSKLKLHCCVWGLGILAPTLCVAQQHRQVDIFALSLEELMDIKIQSANKTSQALNEIPAQVSLITRQDISTYGYTRLVDILRNMPHLYIEEDTEEVFIGTRGAINGGVLFLVNGIPQHPSVQKGLSTVESNRLNIPVAAIDRIEFIHGPMSVVYGNNAFQGTLNIVTQESEHNQIKLGVGDDSGAEVFLHGADDFQDGRYSINLGASRQGGFSGDYAQMMNSQELANLQPYHQQTMDGHFARELQSFDGMLNWRAWELGLNYHKTSAPLYPALTPLEDNPLELATWQAHLKYQLELVDGWRTGSTLIASKDTYEIDRFRFYTLTSSGYQHQGSRRMEFEQNLTYESEQGESLLLGYRYLKLDQMRNKYSVGFLTPGDLFKGNHYLAPTEAQDVFAQWQHVFSSAVRLTTGLRYSRQPGSYRVLQEAEPEDVLYAHTISKDRNLLNYRLALLYQINDRHQLKLLHGTASQDVEIIQFSEPKEIRTSEFVHIYERPHWLLTQSVFSSNTNHLTRRSIAFEGARFVQSLVNNGRWKTYGYELTSEFRPTNSWRISAAMTHQMTEDNNSALDVGYSPETLLQLKTDYHIGDHTLAAFAHYVSSRHSDWRYVGSTADNQPDTEQRIGETAGGYWNLNANWRYQIRDDLAANLNISNLADKEYRYPTNEVSSFSRGLIAEGRIITVGLSWTF